MIQNPDKDSNGIRLVLREARGIVSPQQVPIIGHKQAEIAVSTHVSLEFLLIGCKDEYEFVKLNLLLD
jgi:hypothetical protein